MKKKRTIKTWGETRYTKRIRITEEDDNYIKRIRGQNTSAGTLEEIIKFFKKHNKKRI